MRLISTAVLLLLTFASGQVRAQTDSCSLPKLDYSKNTWKSASCADKSACGSCEATLRQKLQSKIDSEVKTGRITSVDAFLTSLKADRGGLAALFNNWIVITDSDSLQRSTVDQPRLLLKSENAEILMTYSSLGHAPSNNHPGSNSVEFITFKADAATPHYEMTQIDFSSGRGVVTVNPPKCLNCHGNPPHPKWDSYHWAQGSIPLQKDEIRPDCGEGSMFKHFLTGIENRSRDKNLTPLNFSTFAQLRQRLTNNDEYLYPHKPFAACTDAGAKGPLHVGMTDVLYDQISEQNTCRIASELQNRSTSDVYKYALVGTVYCMDTDPASKNIDEIKAFFPADVQALVRQYYVDRFGAATVGSNESTFLYRDTDGRAMNVARGMEQNMLRTFEKIFGGSQPQMQAPYTPRDFPNARNAGERELACNAIVSQRRPTRVYSRVQDRPPQDDLYGCDPETDPLCVEIPNFRSREDDLKTIAAFRYTLEMLGVSMDQWSPGVDPQGFTFHNSEFSNNLRKTKFVRDVIAAYRRSTGAAEPVPRVQKRPAPAVCAWLATESRKSFASPAGVQAIAQRPRPVVVAKSEIDSWTLPQLRQATVDVFVRNRCTQCHSTDVAVSLQDIGAHPIFGAIDSQGRPEASWVTGTMDSVFKGQSAIVLGSLDRLPNDPKRMPFYGAPLTTSEKEIVATYFRAIE